MVAVSSLHTQVICVILDPTNSVRHWWIAWSLTLTPRGLGNVTILRVGFLAASIASSFDFFVYRINLMCIQHPPNYPQAQFRFCYEISQISQFPNFLQALNTVPSIEAKSSS